MYYYIIDQKREELLQLLNTLFVYSLARRGLHHTLTVRTHEPPGAALLLMLAPVSPLASLAAVEDAIAQAAALQLAPSRPAVAEGIAAWSLWSEEAGWKPPPTGVPLSQFPPTLTSSPQ